MSLSSGYTKAVLARLPFITAAYAIAAGIVSLLGWVLGLPRLTDWNNDGIIIKANAAIAVTAAGLALLMYALAPGRLKWLVRGMAVFSGLVGFLTFLQHIFPIDLGIDELLFREAPGALATTSPGRMGIPASTSLTLIGLGLVFFTYERLKRWGSFLGLVAMCIASLSLVGYWFGANQLYAIPRLTGIAWQTATMLAALGLGLTVAVPGQGVAGIVSRDDAGGVVFRRLFVPIVIISLVLGWLRVAGQEAGLYDTAFGTALRTLLEIAMLLGLLWWTGNDISRSDFRARAAAAEVDERDEIIRGVLESLSDVYLAFDSELRVTDHNAAAAELFRRNGIETKGLEGRNVFDALPGSRETALGAALLRSAREGIPMDIEEYYPPFQTWFHARSLPTAGGGLSLFALDITTRKQAEQAVRRKAHELAVLYDFVNRLNTVDDLNEVYEAALDTIVSALDCDRASILLFGADGVMRFVAARGLSEGYKAAVTGHSPWKQGDKNAKPLGIPDVSLADIDADLRSVIIDEGIAALGFIPLVVNERLIGKFMVYYDQPHEFTDTEFDLASTIGYQIALGVEQKHTERALIENEERMRLATQTGMVGIWDWDIRTDQITWTEPVYEMHGVSPETFENNVEAFSALIHPEDRDMVVGRIKGALERNEPYEAEFRVLKPDGTIGWLFTNALVLRDAAGPYRMIGATIDVTERKLAEVRSATLAAIVNSSRDAIISKNLKGVITSWNRGAERIFGYSADEAVGRPITMLIPDERVGEETEILNKLQRGEYIDHLETVRVNKAGKPLDISLSVSPVTDAGGRIVGASKIARDITEQRQAEAAIRSREIMQRLVEAQEAERHRIARDLHDHLGQQVTALRLKLESIRARCNGNHDLLQDVDETQMFASRLDMDINYLAWELRPTELDSLGLQNALGSFVREWSHTYGIPAEFHSSLDPGLRLPAETETNLYRIVQEALNNILKHAAAKQVNVLLEQRRGQIVLIIEDDGHGFDAAAPATARAAGNLNGLGLVGMRERAALLGGALDIESDPGTGTTIYARIPLPDRDEDAVKAAS